MTLINLLTDALPGVTPMADQHDDAKGRPFVRQIDLGHAENVLPLHAEETPHPSRAARREPKRAARRNAVPMPVAERDAARGYSVDTKMVGLAYGIELGVIATLAFVGWSFAERYATDALTYQTMIAGALLMALGELARVPLALACARSAFRVRRACLLIVLALCVIVSAKGIAQVTEQMFHPRLVEVAEARMLVARHEGELATVKAAAELPSRENTTIDQRLSDAKGELEALSSNLNTIGARPKGQPIWKTNRNGKRFRDGVTKPAWDGAKTQAQIEQAQDRIEKLHAEKAALASVMSEAEDKVRVQERKLTQAQHNLEQVLLHSQLHSFAGMMVGKASVDVSDAELHTLMFWFILVASFGIATAATAIAYGSVTRLPQPKPAPQPKTDAVQPVLKIVPDIKAAMKAL